MVTINAASLTNLVNSTITASIAEEIIDQSINELVANGCTISNMTGAAGTKTWTGTQREKGVILSLAMEYYQYHQSSGSSATSWNISGMGSSTSTSQGGGMGRIHDVAKILARKLKTPQFVVAHDTADIEE